MIQKSPYGRIIYMYDSHAWLKYLHIRTSKSKFTVHSLPPTQDRPQIQGWYDLVLEMELNFLHD
ncbi:hypothetical protein FRC16_003872, partial [Serendipita sp. 398]